ncbi:AI-2E family transporter [Jhaorihella thermophila]|uniref:Predicted PurR-regulated permease PerM n=1 Tax=Jhaorihella thermophila TaxID=488547 RepID=A0A1H5SHM2_9RHOB|nr:AI-2E family transporter [Jhaorihella thermophila]SEF49950.1 Predicted PurR-regulated permease PerM [Jhaorihella thermophila]
MKPAQPFSAESLRWTALLAATVLISVVVFNMTRGLLEPLVLAAITGAMVHPMNARLADRLGGRRSVASGISLVLMLLLVILPLIGLIAVAVSQADSMARGVGQLAIRFNETDWDRMVPDWLPWKGRVEDLWPRVLNKLGDLIQAMAAFFVSSLSSMTLGAATFFLKLFVFFYSLFFFLQMDTPILLQLLRFTGLAPETQETLNDRIMSISRATIKGTLLIAIIQGALGGAAFWAAGVPGSAFWAVVMMVFAVLPALGAPFVLFGGAIYLGAKGDYAAAVGVAVWAAAVVSTIDNLLRPVLVGRDARLHDIIILVSTLGGLAMFGASGMILGPVLAGLFVTIWTTLAESIQSAGEPQ